VAIRVWIDQASGDPTDRRVVIWTRVSGAAGDAIGVQWRLAELESGRPAGHGQTLARADADWTVSVDVGGLRPNTSYTYAFEVDGEVSPTGRTRTLPDGDVGRTRFAQVSCAKYNAGHFNAYARLAERDDIAFILHLGDWIYEASQNPPASQTPSKDIGRPFDPLHECRTLEDYRTRYAQYRLDPHVQAVAAAHPFIGTVDDHEFADGAWREGATEHKPEYGPWSERKANAFRAREEWLPIRRPDPDNPERVYRSVPIGDLADLFLIDTRTRRDEPVPEPEMSKPDRTALGPEQRQWLLDSIDASTATWRLLANPSVMGRTWSPDLPEDVKPGLVKVKLLADDGNGPDFDQWDGYPVEREMFLDHIADNGIDNLVVLSGDVHVSLVLDLHHNEDEPVAAEAHQQYVDRTNLDDKMKWPRRSAQMEEIVTRAEEFLKDWRWADLDSHGYVVIDVTPAQVTAQYWHVDSVIEPTPNEELACTWAVEHGSRRATQVA